MRRFLHILAACLIVLVPGSPGANAGRPGPDGLFRGRVPEPRRRLRGQGRRASRACGRPRRPSAPSSTWAARSPTSSACIDYVKSCCRPRERRVRPDARRQARRPDDRRRPDGRRRAEDRHRRDDATAAIAYLTKNVEDVRGDPDRRRRARGGQEDLARLPRLDRRRSKADRNPDGTWGQGPAEACDTGGAAVALLADGREARQDATPSSRPCGQGQRPDGGWSKDERRLRPRASTLPDHAGVLHAQGDSPTSTSSAASSPAAGSPTAAMPSSPGGAADLERHLLMPRSSLRWARQLGGEPPIVETAGFVPLFNGKDLTGWEGDTSLWSARDGMLVGTSPGLEAQRLPGATERELRRLHPQAHLPPRRTARATAASSSAASGSRGTRCRATRPTSARATGAASTTSRGGTRCWSRRPRRRSTALHKTGWNHYVIRAMGDQITLSLNGVPSVDYKETDADIARDGQIAVQIHAGGPMEVQFKDI